MNLLKTSIGIGKTIKNVQRLKEIVQVFIKHGFQEFVDSSIFSKIPNFKLPDKNSANKILKIDASFPEILGKRLRMCFQELGPVFIKFGQLLSSREDLFNPLFLKELHMLKDKVKPITFKNVIPTFKKAYGENWAEIFQKIEKEPIGMASIGVVFEGTLKNGSHVAIKVLHPGIEKKIIADFEILKLIALGAEKISHDLKYLRLPKLLDTFAISLEQEINFYIEASNCERLKASVCEVDDDDIIYMPKIYHELSSQEILVMEFIDGIPFSNIEKIKAEIPELDKFLERGMRIFLKSFLINGLFHADLHGGNFFYYKNKLAVIDFGAMGSLTHQMRRNFIAIIYSIVNSQYEQLVYEFLDVAEYDEMPNISELISDIKSILSTYGGLSVRQTNISVILNQVLIGLRKHKLYLPRDWYIVFRALGAMDGTARDFNVDFDLYQILQKQTKGLLADAMGKDVLMSEVAWATKDLLVLMRILPRHIKWFFNKFSKNGYTLDLKIDNFESSIEHLSHSIYKLGLLILSGITILAGSLQIRGDITSFKQVPVLALILWGLALGLFVLSLMSKK